MILTIFLAIFLPDFSMAFSSPGNSIENFTVENLTVDNHTEKEMEGISNPVSQLSLP